MPLCQNPSVRNVKLLFSKGISIKVFPLHLPDVLNVGTMLHIGGSDSSDQRMSPKHAFSNAPNVMPHGENMTKFISRHIFMSFYIENLYYLKDIMKWLFRYRMEN